MELIWYKLHILSSCTLCDLFVEFDQLYYLYPSMEGNAIYVSCLDDPTYCQYYISINSDISHFGPCIIERYLAAECEEPEMPVRIWSREYKNFGKMAVS